MPTPPKLRVVKEREGNTSRKPIKPGIALPAVIPAEPDWHEPFPVVKGPLAAENKRCREVAARTWEWITGVLAPVRVLTVGDLKALTDFCVLDARIDQGERQLSTEGLTCRTERGVTKHPTSSQLNAWRTAYWGAMRDYGLTALARDRLNPRDGDGDNDADFDRPADPSVGDPQA